MTMRVIRPGLLTTVQDTGRYGYQKHGVIVSGAMDPFAHRAANLLVGNRDSDATLEMTLIGAALEFTEDALIAICGADLSPTIDGVPVPLWKPVWVKKGTVLESGGCRFGARSYLAVAGGIQVPVVMNSRSTYLRAGIGGHEGRPLRAGDVLKSGPLPEQSALMIRHLRTHAEEGAFVPAEWGIGPELLPMYESQPVIRAIRGSQWDWFAADSQEAFFSQPFRVTPQSDRMGYRLEGPVLSLVRQTELISEAVSFGTVQVPAEGKPIVLLADRQTTGGYPKIAQIASVDLPLIAQTKPGDVIRFVEISRDEAEALLLDRECSIRQAKLGIQFKLA
jgi:antagonist of KipI